MKVVRDMGLHFSNGWSIKFHKKSWANKGCQMIFRYYLFYNDPPKEHLTAKGFRGFVVEFNTYNIPAVESPVTYPFLARRTSIIPVEAAVATAKCCTESGNTS